MQIKLKCFSKNIILTAAMGFWCSYLKLICAMTVLSAFLPWAISHSDCPWPNQKMNLISLMQKVIGFLFMECIPLMTVSASANLAATDLTLIWWYDFKQMPKLGDERPTVWYQKEHFLPHLAIFLRKCLLLECHSYETCYSNNWS